MLSIRLPVSLTPASWYTFSIMKTDFIVVSRTRNIPKILEVRKALDSINKTYYCFATNEISHKKAGFNLHDHPDKLADGYENREFASDAIRIIFEDDLSGS